MLPAFTGFTLTLRVGPSHKSRSNVLVKFTGTGSRQTWGWNQAIELSRCQVINMCLVTQSCLTLCNPVDCSPPGSSVHGDSPGKNTGVGCHVLQGTEGLNPGIFPTQGSNPVVPLAGGFFTNWATREAPEYKSGFPSPGEPPDPGIKLESLVLQADSLPAELPRKPCYQHIQV